MKATWLVLVGATSCSFKLDQGSDSNDAVVDAGASTSTVELTTSTFETSSAVASPGTSIATSSSSTASATTESSSPATTSTSPATHSSPFEATDASVESTSTADAGTESAVNSSRDSVASESDGNDSAEELPVEEEEPGKLAGITERHNYYREMVNTDEPLPDLVWDPEIAVLAQEWAEVLAEDCSFEHSGRQGLGENLATFGASTESGLNNTGVDAVDMWHSEVDCYTYGTIAGQANMGTEECSAECDEYGGCGHYTQVVWRGTLRVGCGVASCFKEGFYWDTYVCNYDPPGNFIGEYPY